MKTKNPKTIPALKWGGALVLSAGAAVGTKVVANKREKENKLIAAIALGVTASLFLSLAGMSLSKLIGVLTEPAPKEEGENDNPNEDKEEA